MAAMKVKSWSLRKHALRHPMKSKVNAQYLRLDQRSSLATEAMDQKHSTGSSVGRLNGVKTMATRSTVYGMA